MTEQSEERDRRRAALEFADRTGPAWIERLDPELSRLPKGTFVVVNCVTGEYVTGTTLRQAMDTFEQRFGKTIAHVHEIGGGFFVGGGIV